MGEIIFLFCRMYLVVDYREPRRETLFFYGMGFPTGSPGKPSIRPVLFFLGGDKIGSVLDLRPAQIDPLGHPSTTVAPARTFFWGGTKLGRCWSLGRHKSIQYTMPCLYWVVVHEGRKEATSLDG